MTKGRKNGGRRHSGEGHVRKRGNVWEWIIDLGSQPAQRCRMCGGRYWVDGLVLRTTCECGENLAPPVPERRQRSKGGFTSEAECRRELRTVLVELDKGRDPFPREMKLRDFITAYLDHLHMRPTPVRPRTHQRYRELMSEYVLPELGNLLLHKIQSPHVQRVLDHMGGARPRPCTIVQCRAVLNGAMRTAVAWGLRDTNPVLAVKPPALERPELDVPDGKALNRLIENSEKTVWAIPILLAALTGMRRSEVLGLRWQDLYLDEERPRIEVRQGLHRVPSPNEKSRSLGFLPPKTTRSRRPVKLPAWTREVLRRHHQQQTARRLRQGLTWKDHDLVCDRGDGGPLDPDAFTHGFKRLAAAAGLSPRTRLHDLRHAVGTIVTAAEGAAIAAAMLGHSNAAFTINTYVKATEEMADRAADALDAAIGITES